MSKRVCIEPDCPTLTDKTRCERHRSERERARGTRQERGYDADYDRRRRSDLDAYARGDLLTCWRCGYVVLPAEYSLGHCDDDRTVIHGPEHLRACNLPTSGRREQGCPHPSHISPAA